MTFTRLMLPLVLLLLAACAQLPDAGGTCGIRRVAQLPLHEASSLGEPVVDVRINGQSARLMLATGVAGLSLTTAAAQRLRLPITQINPDLSAQTKNQQQRLYLPVSPQARFSKLFGAHPVEALIVRRLDIGKASLRDIRAELAKDVFSLLPAEADGYLGIGLLQAFTLDIDIPQHQLTIYHGRPCTEATFPGVGKVTAVDMPPFPGNLPTLPVLLDGKPHIAVLDTNLPIIILSRWTADIDWNRSPHVGQPGQFVETAFFPFTRDYARLQIGADTLRNVKILITDGPPPMPDIRFGLSYLLGHRVILSMPDRRVYFPTASDAVPATINSSATSAAEK